VPLLPFEEKDKMAFPKLHAALLWSERRHGAALLFSAVLLTTHSVACSARFMGVSEPEQITRAPQSHVLPTEAAADCVAKNAPGNGTIQLTSKAEPDDLSQPKPKITLPMAIAMCVNNNFRVIAAAQGIRMAEADLLTSSLIPNPSLFTDYQLVPLQHTDVKEQLGPPQADALVSVPIDWLLFGKRVAAMEAARLGIDISSADHADVLRLQVSRTVDAFYEVLMDDAYFKLAEKNLDELMEVEKITQEQAKNNKVGQVEVDRSKLAVHEALLQKHDAEMAVDIAKTKLRPLLGRTAADADYEVEGELTVFAVVPAPKLAEAIALAEANRPDLLSGRRAIDQANAVVQMECRKAWPQVAIQPGWSYQNQYYVDGFRNGSMFDIGISTTLPITDRNQGNIHKAQAQAAQRQFNYEGDRADALAEVEAGVATYDHAVEHLTQLNTEETLKAGSDLLKNMEASYRTGDRKLIELLDAQRANHDRLAHVIEFQSDYWRALNKLNEVVGLRVYDPEKTPTQLFGKDDGKK
jgi:outer membrane protein, heavy metal efflux system